jgi:GGDEF domain-containing protein
MSPVTMCCAALRMRYLRQRARSDDRARMGGDEFAVLLDSISAEKLAEKASQSAKC